MAEDLSADVVIVGTGICGSFVAHEMAKAGLSVIMLEAGPRIDRDEVVENWRNMPPHNKSEYDYATPYPLVPWAPHTNYFPTMAICMSMGRIARPICRASSRAWAARRGTGRRRPGAIWSTISS
jgi:choline dehydrogenase-like flavoprotein